VVAPRMLVAFHSCAEHSPEVASEIAGYLRSAAVQVDLRRVEAAPDPSDYDAVAIGDGDHGPGLTEAVASYTTRYARALAARPCGLFVVGPHVAAPAATPVAATAISASEATAATSSSSGGTATLYTGDLQATAPTRDAPGVPAWTSQGRFGLDGRPPARFRPNITARFGSGLAPTRYGWLRAVSSRPPSAPALAAAAPSATATAASSRPTIAVLRPSPQPAPGEVASSARTAPSTPSIGAGTAPAPSDPDHHPWHDQDQQALTRFARRLLGLLVAIRPR
jgi:hypothetical protein